MLRQVHEYSGFPGRKVKVSIRERVCVKNPSFILISLLFMPHCHPCICFFSTASGKCPQTFQCKGTIVGGLGTGWLGASLEGKLPNHTPKLQDWWTPCSVEYLHCFQTGLTTALFVFNQTGSLTTGNKKKIIISSPLGPSGWTTAQLRDALAVDQSQHHGQRQSQTLHSKI